MEITGPLVEAIKNKNPGPGSYHIPSSLDRISYSIGKKYSKDDLWKMTVPGPGQCNNFLDLRRIHQYHKRKRQLLHFEV